MTSFTLVLILKPHRWPTRNFQYHFNIKLTGDENIEKYQSRDCYLIQYQILWNNIVRIVRQTVRSLSIATFGVKGWWRSYIHFYFLLSWSTDYISIALGAAYPRDSQRKRKLVCVEGEFFFPTQYAFNVLLRGKQLALYVFSQLALISNTFFLIYYRTIWWK